MPLVLRDSDPENRMPGAWPMWGTALVVLGAGLFVLLAFHATRGQAALGIDGQALHLATVATVAATFTLGWILERRRRRA